MDKFVAFMEKHFIPVASKIGAQPLLFQITSKYNEHLQKTSIYL